MFLLTATPVQNDLVELFNLLTLLEPGHLRTESDFKRNMSGGEIPVILAIARPAVAVG